jgi:hypothetical protein
MTPVLVTPPSELPVRLADLQSHLRIDSDDDLETVEGYAAAAVAYLDGWSGVLGRCIMPQVWKVRAYAGDVVLPMPDVSDISADYAAGPEILTAIATASGPCVTITEDCDITFTCAMPAHFLPLARQAVKLLVGHWYENREAVGAAMHETPMALDAIITAIRWRKV